MTQGELDNGRGRARLNLFRHLHEVQTGRTSSISLDFVGFDSDGKVINYAENTIEEICDKSTKLVTLIDLAGHQKYLKTTIFGLTGYQPHCIMLCVAANMGLAGTTKEHLGLALALEMPVCVVITKCDTTSPSNVERVVASVESLLKGPGCKKIPSRVWTEDDAISIAGAFDKARVVPLFCVSAVNGEGLPLLERFLNVLPPTTHGRSETDENQGEQFNIDEIFNVSNVGIIAVGLLMSGCVREGDRMLAGPDPQGDFHRVRVDSVHRNKTACRLVQAGQAASLAVTAVGDGGHKNGAQFNGASQLTATASAPCLTTIKGHNNMDSINYENSVAWLRKGMVLIHESASPQASFAFRAKIYILYHPSQQICVGFHTTVHIGHICQTVRIVDMDVPCLKTTDTGIVTFVFLQRPEYITVGTRLLLRTGKTKAIGQITHICVDPTEYPRSPSVCKIAKT
jgi:GTPase